MILEGLADKVATHPTSNQAHGLNCMLANSLHEPWTGGELLAILVRRILWRAAEFFNSLDHC